MVEAAELAVQRINASGGVLGRPVRVTVGRRGLDDRVGPHRDPDARRRGRRRDRRAGHRRRSHSARSTRSCPRVSSRARRPRARSHSTTSPTTICSSGRSPATHCRRRRSPEVADQTGALQASDRLRRRRLRARPRSRRSSRRWRAVRSRWPRRFRSPAATTICPTRPSSSSTRTHPWRSSSPAATTAPGSSKHSTASTPEAWRPCSSTTRSATRRPRNASPISTRSCAARSPGSHRRRSRTTRTNRSIRPDCSRPTPTTAST